ncbi:MAG: MFS transporter [Chloroflexota bacterium]
MALSGKKPGIFYGWWVLGACVLMGLYTAGVVFYGFTAVFEPIVNEFGWSYTQVSLASSIRGVETGLLAPFVGLLVDRFGPRVITFVGGITVGAGLLVFSRVHSLFSFYIAFILLAIGMSACGHITFIATAANWFHKKLSLAMGITMAGFGFSGLLVPLVVRMVDGMGWRRALNILGLATFLIVLPLSFVIRDRPERYGYLPDGEPPAMEETRRAHHGNTTASPGVSMREALASRAFWHIAIAYVLQFTLFSTVTTHIMPYLSSVGFARALASLAASALPVISGFGRLGFGWLGDRLNGKRLTAVALVLEGLGVLFFVAAVGSAKWLLVLFIILFGPAFGGAVTMRPVMTRELFGAEKFASIFGIMTGITTVGSVVGPLVAGMVFDRYQTYLPIWYIYGGLVAISALVIATTPALKTQKAVTSAQAQKEGGGSGGELKLSFTCRLESPQKVLYL